VPAGPWGRGREWALSLVVVLCHYEAMAKTVIVKLIDDIDGGDADETVRFSLDEKTFEIDLNATNAARLRSALQPFADKARAVGVSRGARPAASETLYSRLSDDEKARFRTWADMATARRISDARVKSWEAAGKP
jgi:Lsr2